MKRLTFHGPGHILKVPGCFTVGLNEPVDIDEHLARALLVANPDLILTVEDIPATRKTRTDGTASGGAEPEARRGEGHNTDPHEEE